MNNYFDSYIVQFYEGCNCCICKRSRYERDLVKRLGSQLESSFLAELKKYLEWYWDALEAAETEVEGMKLERERETLAS